MIELAGDSLYHGDYRAMRAWASRAVEAGAHEQQPRARVGEQSSDCLNE
jgi:hypothetical protein